MKRILGRQIDSRNNDVYHSEFNPAPDDVQPYLIVRDDDTKKRVKHRYNVYKQLTEPLLKYYSERLITIDCNQDILDIYKIMNEHFYERSIKP